MKVHVLKVELDQAHIMVETDAVVHDTQLMDNFLRSVTWRVIWKAPRENGFTFADWSFNRKSSRARTRVEYFFGVVKNAGDTFRILYRDLNIILQRRVFRLASGDSYKPNLNRLSYRRQVIAERPASY